MPIALVVALGATGTFVALGAAERTAGAYARYLEQADVGDMVLNPSLNTASADRAVRALPGIRSVTSDVLLIGGIDDRKGVPRTAAEVTDEGNAISTMGSADGRYSSMDRPILTAGRLPSDVDEVVVNRELATARGLAVGHRLTVSLWDPRDDILATPTTWWRPSASSTCGCPGWPCSPTRCCPTACSRASGCSSAPS